jgi:hypothetical protein
LTKPNVVLYAINLANHNGHVASLQVTSRVVNAKVVHIRDTRDVRDDDFLSQNRGVKRDARELLVGESVNEGLEMHTARSELEAKA